MSETDDVRTFAREYINHPGTRTPERKAKIKSAIRNLTGRILDNSCGTCYIEALFTILNFSNMASSKYVVKRGVVLQPFGHPEMSCDCYSITDEKGDWIAAHQPELLRYFDKYPPTFQPGGFAKPTGITIIPPVQPLPEMSTKIVEAMTNSEIPKVAKSKAKASPKKR